MRADHLENIKRINQMIMDDPSLIAPLMHLCGEHLDKFRENSKKQNDNLLREALGDACHIIGLDRKPTKKTLAMHCARIVEAIFPKGIVDYHHEGEKRFYEKIIEPFKDKNAIRK